MWFVGHAPPTLSGFSFCFYLKPHQKGYQLQKRTVSKKTYQRRPQASYFLRTARPRRSLREKGPASWHHDESGRVDGSRVDPDSKWAPLSELVRLFWWFYRETKRKPDPTIFGGPNPARLNQEQVLVRMHEQVPQKQPSSKQRCQRMSHKSS